MSQSTVVHEGLSAPRQLVWDDFRPQPPMSPEEMSFDQRVSALADDIRGGRIATVEDVLEIRRVAGEITAMPGEYYVNHTAPLNQQDAEMVWAMSEPSAWVLDEDEVDGLTQFDELVRDLVDGHNPSLLKEYLEPREDGLSWLDNARQWVGHTLGIDPRALHDYTLGDLARMSGTRLKLSQDLEESRPDRPDKGGYRGRHRAHASLAPENSVPQTEHLTALSAEQPRTEILPSGQSGLETTEERSIFDKTLPPRPPDHEIRSHRREKSRWVRRLAIAAGVVALAGATVLVGVAMVRGAMPWQHDPSAATGLEIVKTFIPPAESLPSPAELPSAPPIDLHQYPWEVAHAVAPGNEHQLIQQAIEVANSQGHSFSIEYETPDDYQVLYDGRAMDGQHLLINEQIANLGNTSSTSLART